MAVTVSIFYYFFLLVVLVFLLYSFFNVYHLMRFGFFSVVNILVIVAYLFISAWYLFFAFSLLMAIDWSLPLVDTNSFFNVGDILNIGLDN